MKLCVVCDAPLPENTGGRPRITCSPKCAAKRRAARDALATGWAEANATSWEESAAQAEATGATWAPAYRRYAQEAAERLALFRKAAR